MSLYSSIDIQQHVYTQSYLFKNIFVIMTDNIYHGHIIKWTKHIGVLILADMARVVEGNHRNDSKRRVGRILCLSQFGEI